MTVLVVPIRGALYIVVVVFDVVNKDIILLGRRLIHSGETIKLMKIAQVYKLFKLGYVPFKCLEIVVVVVVVVA